MKKIRKKISLKIFKILRTIIRFFYPKTEIEGIENIPDGSVVFVGNHCQIHGPLICEFYMKDNCYTWCAGQMMNLKEVPAYAFEDFWSNKPKYSHIFYRILSYIIAPLSVLIFNNARTIAVYRDSRIISTFRTTLARLQNGQSIVIFPEYNKKHNNIIYDFQTKFVDIAQLYYKKSGKILKFIPVYIAPKLNKMYYGKAIAFCPDNPIIQERSRICDYIMYEITEIAKSLPEHTVIPYRNISKKLYPKNTCTEVSNEEKTGC